jgi:hypothetical protein
MEVRAVLGGAIPERRRIGNGNRRLAIRMAWLAKLGGHALPFSPLQGQTAYAEAPQSSQRPLIFHSTLVLCTVFSIFARGYGFGLEDQNLYLPFLFKWNSPGLFPHDYLLQMGYARESVSWLLLSLLARKIPVKALFLIIYVAANYMVLLLTHKTVTILVAFILGASHFLGSIRLSNDQGTMLQF